MSSEQIKQLLNESAIASAPIEEVEIFSQGSEPLIPVPSAVPEASPEKQASNILSAQIPIPIRNAEPSGTSHVLKTRKDLIQ